MAASPVAPRRVTVKLAVCPSVTEASPIENDAASSLSVTMTDTSAASTSSYPPPPAVCRIVAMRRSSALLRSSSSPVSVTSWRVSHVVGVKVSSDLLTVATVPSVLDSETVTSLAGRVPSQTS